MKVKLVLKYKCVLVRSFLFQTVISRSYLVGEELNFKIKYMKITNLKYPFLLGRTCC